MTLETYFKYHGKKIVNHMFTDFVITQFDRVDLVVRIRFAETINNLANLKSGDKLFGRLHRTNLTVKSEYGLVTENVQALDVTLGEYKEDYSSRHQAMDAVSFELHDDNKVSFCIYKDGELIKANTDLVFTNAEY